MWFDRFDIVHAHYLFYSWNHSGQGCEMYSRLSSQILVRLKYRPASGIDYKLENENQLRIFNSLAQLHGCEDYSASNGVFEFED